jgi:uncharacterized protein YheU (UPF0270 family)
MVNEGEGTNGVVIPPERVAAEILRAVIEEFVLQEGTDYGHHDFSLEQKVTQVERQISRGEIELVFDPVSESCSLRRKSS